MILGGCPYDDCGYPMMLPLQEPGHIERHSCEGCERVIWTHHSRVDPWSMTDAGFREEYEVDDEAKTFKKREVP